MEKVGFESEVKRDIKCAFSINCTCSVLPYILDYKSKYFGPILALKARGRLICGASWATIIAVVAAAHCRRKQLQNVPTALLPTLPPAV